MRLAFLILVLAAPLSAQDIAASNQSDKTPLNTLAVWEEAVAVLRQAEGLHDALSSGEYNFDISADACLSIRAQQRSGLPPALPDPIPNLGTNTDECEVRLTEEYVKEALHGWQYDFPASAGSDHTVCASGCDYTSIETAIAAAACGDTVTCTAGETFAVGSNEISVAKHCSEAAPLWIRSSEWASFTPGVRITGAEAADTCKVTATGNESPFTIDPVRITISDVDAGTDTLTTASPHGLSVGDIATFTSDSPQPLDDTRRYWVLTAPTSTTFTVSRYENASAETLDITGAASGSLVKPTQWIRFTGIYPEPVGGDKSAALIDFLNDPVYLPEAMPNHIWFDHVLLRGNEPDLLRRGVSISGQYFAFTDSDCANVIHTSEPQCLVNWTGGSGPFWIENNGLESGGENVMWGGAFGANRTLNPGSHGTLTLKGNHLYKDPAWKWTTLASAPTTPCVPEEKWQDTSGAPDYYVCDAGGASWSASSAGAFPENNSAKNIFETKKVVHSQNYGNIYEFSWARDGSQHGTLLSIKQTAGVEQNGPFTETRNVLLYGEIIRKGGMLATIAVPPSTVPSTPRVDDMTGIPGNYALWNILAHDIDPELYDSSGNANTTNNSFPITGLSPDGISIRHLTLLPPAYPTVGNSQRMAANSSDYSGGLIEHITLADSIVSFSTVFSSGKSEGCTSLSHDWVTFTGGPNVWVWTDASGPNMSACSAGGAYMETDLDVIGLDSWEGGVEPEDFRLTSAGATNDYRAGGAQDASDGKDLGADIDIVKDLTGGAEAGLLSWSEQHGVAITAAGSTTATVEWDRPNASNSCNFYLYTDYARTAEHADTSGDNGDNRDGGVSAGHVTFALGVNSALTTKTWYWFEIDCPTDEILMVGSLMTN